MTPRTWIQSTCEIAKLRFVERFQIPYVAAEQRLMADVNESWHIEFCHLGQKMQMFVRALLGVQHLCQCSSTASVALQWLMVCGDPYTSLARAY